MPFGVNWEKTTLAEITDYKTGKLNSNAAVEKGEYPFFTCSRETFRTNTWSFDCECVLLAGNNANAEYPVKYFKGKFDAYQRTYVITSKDPAKLNIRYLYYCIELKLNLLKSLSTGSATRFLTKGILDNLEFSLPPKDIQDILVGVLGSYDNLIENNNRRITILEDMAQSLYREWFVKFRYPGHENQTLIDSPLGPIPDGWAVKLLDDVLETIVDYRGKTPKKLGGDWVESGVKALSALNVKHGGLIRLESCKQVSSEIYDKWMKVKLQENDILLTSEAPLGEVALLKGQTEFCLSQRLYALRADTSIVSPEYIFLSFSTGYLLDQLVSRATGSTVAGIRQALLKEVPILIPSTEIMDTFTRHTSSMLEQISLLWRKNNNLKSQRDMLLPKLISGKINLNDA